MSKKKYTLELTAEELAPGDALLGTMRRLQELACVASADREKTRMGRPWSASGDMLLFSSRENAVRFPSALAANLASAAPDLLAAVQEMHRRSDRLDSEIRSVLLPLIKRALRKVETGVPEEER